MRAVLSAVAVAAAIAFPAEAADIQRDGRFIFIDGTITDGDSAKFARMTSGKWSKPPIVILSGPGGLLGEGLGIGARIRKIRASTGAFGVCASSCAFAWAAGTPAMLVEGSEVLFHSPWNGETRDVSAGGAGVVGAYLTDMGYGIDFIYDALKDNTGMRGFEYSDVPKVNAIYGTNIVQVGGEGR